MIDLESRAAAKHLKLVFNNLPANLGRTASPALHHGGMKTFLAVFNLFPAILGAVQAVEAAVPFPKSGEQKLNLVLAAVESAWQASQQQQDIPKGTMLSAVESLVHVVVASLNALGIFTTTTAPATAAPVSSN